MSSNRPVVKRAYEEMLLEFTENCPARLTKKPRALLEGFFEDTIEVLLTKRKIEWAGRARRFCLAAAAGLGREVHRATLNGAMKESHVVQSMKVLIPYWERICPLPAIKDGEDHVRRDCEILRGVLNMPPAPVLAKKRPARKSVAKKQAAKTQPA